jgi:hypothetical protein
MWLHRSDVSCREGGFPRQGYALSHQSLSNSIIDPGNEVGQAEGDIHCHERLGGLSRYCAGSATGTQ